MTETEPSTVLLRPFPALTPTEASAQAVAAPPYDVMNTEEARAMAAGNPRSFLHVSKPEIDFEPGIDAHAPEVYARGAENLATLVAEGALVRDATPCYYVYRIEMAGEMGNHVQTGIAGAASLAAYHAGRVKKHELTKPDKEEDRANQIEGVNAQTGPVMVVHRQNADVAAVIAAVTAKDADFTATTVDGAVHTLWKVADIEVVSRLADLFEAMDALYIADGHHRSAAAARVGMRRGGDGNASHDRFLVVSFPDTEVQILDYNRVVKDLNGLSPEEFLSRLEADFTVTPADAPVRPARAGEFGVYLDGGWHLLALKETPQDADPTQRLDISQLTEKVLAPVLGIGDSRLDSRIDFIGGARGLEGLMARVDGGGWAVAFSLYPTSLTDLMAVADAGGIMPPKSTWFEPKLADGMVSLVLD